MKNPFKPKAPVKFGEQQLLRLIPLGGVGDVTKNMYVYEYGRDIVIVDCGIGFPEADQLGIDLVIPDARYLRDKKDRIRGFIITHGHDDHIGGLPYIWPEFKAPIYAQKLAAGFIKAKFSEHRLPKEKINTVNADSRLQLGAFKVSFYQVSHSVPDSVGVVLETPAGRVVHQADFKLDWSPVSGQVTEVGKLAMAGEQGVDLLLIDGLGVEKKGYTLSEKTVEPTFLRIEADSPGKLFITTTSSNISRIQQAINTAVKSDRKIALFGRSMESNFQVARDLGYLHVPPGVMISPDEVKRFPDGRLLIIIAGAQGQPGSALSRVANNDHRLLTLKKSDTVVFSADPIPSTEGAQRSLIDKLTKAGVNVFYTAMTDDLHVSGHAGAEEKKVMINLARPKYLLPIGATYSQMKAFSDMVREMGWGEDKVLLVEDGQVINVTRERVAADGKVEAGNVYVDGLGVGDVGNVVLRDRQVMAEEGVVLVVVPVEARTSRLVGEPDIVSRGFVFERGPEGLLDKAKRVVEGAIGDHPEAVLDWRFMRRHIEETLEEFFYKETQRRPMILPVIVEV